MKKSKIKPSEQYVKLRSRITQAIEKEPFNTDAYQDYFDLIRIEGEEERQHTFNDTLWLRNLTARQVKYANLDSQVLKFAELNKLTYLWMAQDDFDSYCIYLEWDRQPNKRFYLPRRKVLKKSVDAMQRLVDDELDELFLSQPPRTGKTTLLMFLVTWLIGRDPEKSNLYSAFSDIITGALYNGVIEVITDPTTYNWSQVFPTATIANTNAKNETLDISRKKRYPSLTCRSLYGTLNGACDCDGFLISDDLIGGIEEALNSDRMHSAWSKVDNNLLTRAKEQAKVLWCGTRWSLIDPAGIRMDLIQNEPKFSNRRFEIINLPALDAEGHSNFNYAYGLGFSDDYYQQKRASFERNNDMASWLAQYQGEPIERSGALFEPQDMKFYNGVLPDEEPTRVFMAVDPAFGGGDFTSAPVCYQYENGDIYVADVVFNSGDKKITQPLIVDMIMKHDIKAVQIEASRSTASYKEEIEAELRKNGIRINLTTRAAPVNKSKEVRIFDKAPEIREFYFLDEGKRSKEYAAFMQNMYSFKLVGKNKHDDSVDSLAQAAEMVTRSMVNSIVVARRRF